MKLFCMIISLVTILFNENGTSKIQNIRLRTFPADSLKGTERKFHSADDIPEQFDSRSFWHYCDTIGEISDQGNCGADWAFGAVSCMNDRICIASNGSKSFKHSIEDLIGCTKGNFGCRYGHIENAWKQWIYNGIVSEECLPYTAFESGISPNCRKSCLEESKKNYTNDKMRGKSYRKLTGMYAIQKEIISNGPVQATMKVFEDFLIYKSGVYSHCNGVELGTQSVKILGWGNEILNNVKVDYWLVANMWGKRFGFDGLFKILRGKNECKIEQNVIAGYV